MPRGVVVLGKIYTVLFTYWRELKEISTALLTVYHELTSWTSSRAVGNHLSPWEYVANWYINLFPFFKTKFPHLKWLCLGWQSPLCCLVCWACQLTLAKPYQDIYWPRPQVLRTRVHVAGWCCRCESEVSVDELYFLCKRKFGLKNTSIGVVSNQHSTLLKMNLLFVLLNLNHIWMENISCVYVSQCGREHWPLLKSWWDWPLPRRWLNRPFVKSWWDLFPRTGGTSSHIFVEQTSSLDLAELTSCQELVKLTSSHK